MPSLAHKRGSSIILSYQESNLVAVKKIKEYGMKTTKWRGYSELAWTEPIIASPEEYVEETEQFSKVIKENSKVDPKHCFILVVVRVAMSTPLKNILR